MILTSKIDKIQIPRNDDGRYTLTAEDEYLVLNDLVTMKRKEVVKKWKISLTKIYWLEHPEKYKEQLERNRKTKTYDKEKARIYKQRNKAKKKRILEKEGDNS